MAFGSYIRKKREEAGIPLRDLAQRIDISPADWSRIRARDGESPQERADGESSSGPWLDLDEVFIEASRLPPDMQRDVRGVVQAYRKFQQSED